MLQCCQFCLQTDRHQLTLTLLLSPCLSLSQFLPSVAFFHCLLGSAVHLTVASLPLVSRICLSRVKGCLQIPFNLLATDGSCQSPSSCYMNDCSTWGLWVWGGLFVCLFWHHRHTSAFRFRAPGHPPEAGWPQSWKQCK